MATTSTQRPAAPAATPGAWRGAVALVKAWFGRNGSQDAGATSELWQLYRMSRGSDSLRPALIRKLATTTVR